MAVTFASLFSMTISIKKFRRPFLAFAFGAEKIGKVLLLKHSGPKMEARSGSKMEVHSGPNMESRSPLQIYIYIYIITQI